MEKSDLKWREVLREKLRPLYHNVQPETHLEGMDSDLSEKLKPTRRLKPGFGTVFRELGQIPWFVRN